MTCALRRCSTRLSYRQFEKHPSTHVGIRHGNAARTGRAASPYRCRPFLRMLRIADCRQSAMGSGASAHVCGSTIGRPCRSIGTQRSKRLDGSSPFLSDASGVWTRVIAWFFPLRTLKPKRPRWLTEGVRVPREIGATDLPWQRESVRRVQNVEATALRRRAIEQAVARGPRCVLFGDVESEMHGRRSVDCVARTKAANDTPAKNRMQYRSSPRKRYGAMKAGRIRSQARRIRFAGSLRRNKFCAERGDGFDGACSHPAAQSCTAATRERVDGFGMDTIWFAASFATRQRSLRSVPRCRSLRRTPRARSPDARG